MFGCPQTSGHVAYFWVDEKWRTAYEAYATKSLMISSASRPQHTFECWNKESCRCCRPATVAVCDSSWFSCLTAFQTVIWSFGSAGIALLHSRYHKGKQVNPWCFVSCCFKGFCLYDFKSPFFMELGAVERWTRPTGPPDHKLYLLAFPGPAAA